ncbi:MAG: DUF4339 domain-containing protein [Parachlamydiaceae bacterium]
MEKTWYINIKGKKVGPYTLMQLKCHPQVTPDTLIWISECSEWVPIRLIPELKDIFKDPEPLNEIDDEEDLSSENLSNTLALELQNDPPQITWLLFLVTLILLILIQILKYKLFR